MSVYNVFHRNQQKTDTRVSIKERKALSMNTGLGLGGFFLLALLWFILKPLLIGLWKGLKELFTGRGEP